MTFVTRDRTENCLYLVIRNRNVIATIEASINANRRHSGESTYSINYQGSSLGPYPDFKSAEKVALSL